MYLHFRLRLDYYVIMYVINKLGNIFLKIKSMLPIIHAARDLINKV